MAASGDPKPYQRLAFRHATALPIAGRLRSRAASALASLSPPRARCELGRGARRERARCEHGPSRERTGKAAARTRFGRSSTCCSCYSLPRRGGRCGRCGRCSQAQAGSAESEGPKPQNPNVAVWRFKDPRGLARNSRLKSSRADRTDLIRSIRKLRISDFRFQANSLWT